MRDKQGREYAKVSDLRAGDLVKVDGDFTCLEPWTTHLVQANTDGLWIDCNDEHHQHYLSGQIDNGYYIGIYKL